jgi:hypothetical protein
VRRPQGGGYKLAVGDYDGVGSKEFSFSVEAAVPAARDEDFAGDTPATTVDKGQAVAVNL